MKAHIVENGIIVNTVEVDSLDALPNLIDAAVGGIGWRYVSGELLEPLPVPITRDELKKTRQAAVAAIKVTVTGGKEFDGDEVSQTRMARAIIGLQAAGQTAITWTLADNTSTEVTLAELTEALILAGQEQARLWVLPE